jgi:hypothetical protein
MLKAPSPCPEGFGYERRKSFETLLRYFIVTIITLSSLRFNPWLIGLIQSIGYDLFEAHGTSFGPGRSKGGFA